MIWMEFVSRFQVCAHKFWGSEFSRKMSSPIQVCNSLIFQVSHFWREIFNFLYFHILYYPLEGMHKIFLVTKIHDKSYSPIVSGTPEKFIRRHIISAL